MKRFVTKVVNLMREEMLFSWQGGPIILLQVRREYGVWALCALVDTSQFNTYIKNPNCLHVSVKFDASW